MLEGAVNDFMFSCFHVEIARMEASASGDPSMMRRPIVSSYACQHKLLHVLFKGGKPFYTFAFAYFISTK